MPFYGKQAMKKRAVNSQFPNSQLPKQGGSKQSRWELDVWMLRVLMFSTRLKAYPLEQAFEHFINRARRVNAEVRLAVGEDAPLVQLFHLRPVCRKRASAIGRHSIDEALERDIKPCDGCIGQHRRAIVGLGKRAAAGGDDDGFARADVNDLGAIVDASTSSAHTTTTARRHTSMPLLASTAATLTPSLMKIISESKGVRSRAASICRTVSATAPSSL